MPIAYVGPDRYGPPTPGGRALGTALGAAGGVTYGAAAGVLLFGVLTVLTGVWGWRGCWSAA